MQMRMIIAIVLETSILSQKDLAAILILARELHNMATVFVAVVSA